MRPERGRNEGNGAKGLRVPQYGAGFKVAELVQDLSREVENAAREAAGQYRVGEGWVSEREVFLLIQRMFGAETEVIQHGRPPELGNQHLDVWLPDWRVGIEYQGLQHDQPVEFFGGEEAFVRNVARDEAKRTKCLLAGIQLVEVRPGYNEGELVAAVRKKRATGPN